MTTVDGTRVALVEDHTLLADSLHMALVAQGFDSTTVPVPRDVDSGRTLLQPILSGRPKVVLLDLDLGPAGDATTLISPLTQAGCAVVVITGSADPGRWGHCLALGSRTVLPKSSSLDEILAVVHAVTKGWAVMPEVRRLELIRRWYQQRSDEHGVHRKLGRLTAREREVLQALAGGKRVREIACESFVSEATVRSQVKSILAKLGVTSQIAAVALARDVGWEPSGH
jgi:two-component system, NarL family, nitrate/nitrite response regulator NarL